jgi:hypothetical protein
MEGTRAAFMADQAGDPEPDGAALSALTAMGRSMNRDWPPTAQYQAIALLSTLFAG